MPTGQAYPNGQHEAGNVSDIAEGELLLVGEAPLVLGRDADGLYAMATICTHQRCDMRDDGSINDNRLECDCHGSAFDDNGRVTSGPADDPLRHYAVTVDPKGHIMIDADTRVPPDERTPVT